MKSLIGKVIESRGLKKKYIAEKLGVNREQVSRWVSGKSYPRLDKAFELAELLGVLVDDLYERDNSDNSEAEDI